MEFEETCLSSAVREMSITDALYKLEASKDIPTIRLVPFNRRPLQYVEFVEQFCGVMYRQHNSPDRFQSYFEETIEKLTSTGKQLYIIGDFNIDLLKFETSV